jgi:hypothetical protein
LAPFGGLPTTTYHEEREVCEEIHSENSLCALLRVLGGKNGHSYTFKSILDQLRGYQAGALDRFHQEEAGTFLELPCNLLNPGLQAVMLGFFAGEPRGRVFACNPFRAMLINM